MPVENMSPILRFGITTGDQRSSYWRLRSGMKKAELYLEREGHGKNWYFSLHESGQWHMKEGGRKAVSWNRPTEIAPGYTRAVGIVQPVAVIQRDDPPAEDVVLVPVSKDAQPTVFSVYIERPGANLAGWPGRNADATTFVGRIPLAADAGTCCVVALQGPLPSGRVDMLRPSDEELRKMRDLAARGVLVTTVIGDFSDGAVALIDLKADPSVVATIDEALKHPS